MDRTRFAGKESGPVPKTKLGSGQPIEQKRINQRWNRIASEIAKCGLLGGTGFPGDEGEAGPVLSAPGAASVRVDGDVSVRLPRRARDAARAPADAALRHARPGAAARRVADAAQPAAAAHRPRKVRRVSREDQHRSVGRPHRHRPRGNLFNLFFSTNHRSFTLPTHPFIRLKCCSPSYTVFTYFYQMLFYFQFFRAS